MPSSSHRRRPTEPRTPPPPDADPAFWQAFGDPQLTSLVEQALAANHDLRIALASYYRANALLRGSKFDYFPTITAGAEGSDSRASADQAPGVARGDRSEEHTSELQSLMRISYAVFCLKKKKHNQ